MTAPTYLGAAALAGHRVDARAGTAWMAPTPVDLDPGASAAGGRPTRLRIPSIGVDTPLEALALDAAGRLESPKVYGKAGWYTGGAVPGEPGPAVVAGHVDSRTGPAVFYRLRDLDPGARVEVESEGQWLVFEVTAVERYAKSEFPSNRVYGPTPVPELRLITCGGEFDLAGHSYRDNVVVYAVQS